VSLREYARVVKPFAGFNSHPYPGYSPTSARLGAVDSRGLVPGCLKIFITVPMCPPALPEEKISFFNICIPQNDSFLGG